MKSVLSISWSCVLLLPRPPFKKSSLFFLSSTTCWTAGFNKIAAIPLLFMPLYVLLPAARWRKHNASKTYDERRNASWKLIFIFYAGDATKFTQKIWTLFVLMGMGMWCVWLVLVGTRWFFYDGLICKILGLKEN